MIQSMTGFGKSVVSLPNKSITIEIKSLNSKNMDLYTRLPSQYKENELQLRTMITAALVRGKVDLSLYTETINGETSAKINAPVIKKYMEQLKEIHETDEKDEVELLKMAINLPDALKTKREEIDKTEFIAVRTGLEEALAALNQFRSDEGRMLEKEFELRIGNLKILLQEIDKIDPERIAGVKDRLQKGITELNANIDENRFEQELVYYIEKYDITEEKTRLNNHLNYFMETINTADSNGKKLGFIAQEIGREINTIGSKSNFAPMQHLVVQMKDELEKIKEQMLNVL